jgi:hypothetical protein
MYSGKMNQIKDEQRLDLGGGCGLKEKEKKVLRDLEK